MKFLASQKLIKDGFVMHILLLVVYGYKKKCRKGNKYSMINERRYERKYRKATLFQSRQSSRQKGICF